MTTKNLNAEEFADVVRVKRGDTRRGPRAAWSANELRKLRKHVLKPVGGGLRAQQRALVTFRALRRFGPVKRQKIRQKLGWI